jgi:uncharacterized membrane protein YagU involved in acid resistance
MLSFADKSFTTALIREAFRSGSIAAVAMIPFGLLFFFLGLRVNEYGMKVIQTFFGDLPSGLRFVLFAVEHFIISWSIALPLLFSLLKLYGRFSPLLVGIAYGMAFYVLINSLALPLIFSDPTPWRLGFDVVYPSLIIHLIYGVSVAITSKRFIVQYAN